jgi:nicotinamidase-related amidase
MDGVPRRLHRDSTTLAVIDMQLRFRDVIAGMPQVLAACSRLVRFHQRLEMPILTTEHYPAGLGATLPELRELMQPFRPLEKISFSCADDAGFRKALGDLHRRQIVLCGIETHICVYQTARDLHAQGLQVVVAADATGSRRVHDRELALASLRGAGVQVLSTETILFEILRVARTADFKAVADILKDG